MTVLDMQAKVSTADTFVTEQKGQRNQILSELSSIDTRTAALQKEVEVEVQTLALLNNTSLAFWEKTKQGIESLVNKALLAVYPDRHYIFKIEQETLRGADHIRFMLDEDGVETDIWEESGLGIADIVGFALRIAYLTLYRPKLLPVLVMDEPFRYVSEKYATNAGRFAKQIAKDLGLQIIMVTHNSAISEQADQIFTCEKTGRITSVSVENFS